jgi:hypothetical protein
METRGQSREQASTASAVTTSTTTEQPESPATKRLRKENNLAIKHKLVKELFEERAKKGTRVMGLIPTLVHKYKKAGYSFITEASVKHYIRTLKDTPAYKLMSCNVAIPDVEVLGPVVDVQLPRVDSTISSDSMISSISPDCSSSRNKGGRPLGTSQELKAAILKAKDQASTECAVLYKDLQDKSRARGGSITKRGTLENIIKETEKKHGLLKGTIKTETIAKRVYRNNLTGQKYQCTSPVAKMEPVLVQYCIRLCKVGKALDKQQVLLLANSLIKNNDCEKFVIAWKKSQGMYDETKPLLGNKWYLSFLKRHSDKIRRGRCKVQDVNRKSWCTYDHFEAMYADVYETMVKAGVAKRLDEECSFDKSGTIINDASDQVFGRKSKYVMEHPEWVLFADETGCNTNQKEDGHKGGQLFVLETGYEEGGLTGVTTDIHFTVMCFTCATGEPVLCVIILKSEKPVEEIPISWKWGIDITKNVDNNGTCQAELFDQNCGEDKIICGGPKCTFQGKDLPCFIGTSPKASITSQMLADILKFLDGIGLYDRTTGKTPFLLVDGHHSRFGLPFLDYIFDNDHPWMVSIGVPYGTHLWQVADSSEQNAAFKKILAEEKAKWLDYRPLNKQKFVPADIVPLVRKAWDRSFGHCHNSKSAIANRGWNPLTYNLLDNKRLAQKIINPNCNPPAHGVVNPLSLNTSVGVAGCYTDIIVDHTKRDEARMEGSRKKRQEKLDNYTNIEAIGKIAGMRSGEMASTGNFTFLPEHRETAKRKIEKMESEKNAKKKRVDDNKLKLTTAFNAAVGKHIRSEELSSDDYRALIKQYFEKGKDSPLKKTKIGLKED